MLRTTATMPCLLGLLFAGCATERAPEPEPALTAAPAPAPEAADVADVAAVVQRFFDALEARDGEALEATMLPGASIHAVAMGPGPELQPPRSRSAAVDVEWLATTTDALLERMWDYEVRVHGRVAMLWTPYDFWRNGEFSHCGVDAFTLVRTADGWRIASIAYTTETEDCPPSPLGRPAV